MAIAWIAWRSPPAVRAWWGAYRDECRDWHHRSWHVSPDGPVREGFFLKSRPPASVALLRMSAMLDEQVHQDAPPSIAIEDAIAWLWRMLARRFGPGNGGRLPGRRTHGHPSRGLATAQGSGDRSRSRRGPRHVAVSVRRALRRCAPQRFRHPERMAGRLEWLPAGAAARAADRSGVHSALLRSALDRLGGRQRRRRMGRRRSGGRRMQS